MTLDELTTPLTAEQFRARIYAGLEAKGVDTTNWKPGAAVRTLIAVFCVVLSAVTELQALIARAGWLEYSTGSWLDLIGENVYGTTRILGTFATGQVRLTNATGLAAFLDVGIGDLVVKHEDSGKTYRNTAPFSLPALAGAFVDVDVRADEIGSASFATANKITGFETVFTGCTVTNAAVLRGTDREEDPAYRARCRAKTGSLSPNGPRMAYVWAATSATRADGTNIGITRVRTIADGMGNVDVYVADADAAVTVDDVALIDARIQSLVVPHAVTATAYAASPIAISGSYELWVHDTISLTDGEIDAQVQSALASYLASVPIGGERLSTTPFAPRYVVRSKLQAVISAAIGDPLVHLTLPAPAADVEIDATEAPTLGAFAQIAVHRVPAGALI